MAARPFWRPARDRRRCGDRARLDADGQTAFRPADLCAAIRHLQPPHRRHAGWPAAPPIPAARCWRIISRPSASPSCPSASTRRSTAGSIIIRCSKPGERFPIADPDLQPRLTPRPADDAVFLRRSSKASPPSRRSATDGSRSLAGRRSAPCAPSAAAPEMPTWTAIRARKLGVPFLPAFGGSGGGHGQTGVEGRGQAGVL